MLLRSGGVDVFYIDESNDKTLFAVTAIAIPFLRFVDEHWNIVWPDYLTGAKEWRASVANELKIPRSKELHAWKLVSARGNYLYGNRQLKKSDAMATYNRILGLANFVPDDSVITVVGSRGLQLYGHERLERVMYALFQRMRRQCVDRKCNAMTYFDQGHNEYRRLYRKAQLHLMTGSRFGKPRNLPLDMFVKDGNEKNSKHCLFTQLADLISYAALARVRHEKGVMEQSQQDIGLQHLYDGLPNRIKNLNAGGADGIVRIG
jgi:hypothetical protein